MTNSRKARGANTERLVAERLRTIWPHCNVQRGNGPDLVETPGYAVEIKARANLAIPAFIKQATANTTGNAIPLLILRLNGQGPASIDDWPVVMKLSDFEDLVRD